MKTNFFEWLYLIEKVVDGKNSLCLWVAFFSAISCEKTVSNFSRVPFADDRLQATGFDILEQQKINRSSLSCYNCFDYLYLDLGSTGTRLLHGFTSGVLKSTGAFNFGEVITKLVVFPKAFNHVGVKLCAILSWQCLSEGNLCIFSSGTGIL